MKNAAIETRNSLKTLTDNELVQAYQNGERGDLATCELLRRYNGFIRKAAWKMGAKFLGRFDFDEIVQVATVGFLNGVSRFDTTSGNKLTTFAVFHVRDELIQFLNSMTSTATNNSSKVRQCVIALRKVYTERERLNISTEFSEADLELVSEAVGQSMEVVRRGLTLLCQQLAPHATWDDIEVDFPTDGGSPFESIASMEIADFLAEMKASIGIREAFIVEEVILSDNPLTNAEAGERLGISEARVRQLKGKALNDMKDMCDERGFVFSDLV